MTPHITLPHPLARRAGRLIAALAPALLALSAGSTALAQGHPPIVALDVPAGSHITITNTGAAQGKAIIVSWNGDDPAPVFVECTGFIAPAGQWTMRAPHPNSPARDHVKVFSFNVKTLLDAGINIGFDDELVADRMCEDVFFSVMGNAGDYQIFEAAYISGNAFKGIELIKTWGGGLNAEVTPSATEAPAVLVDTTLAQRVPTAVLSAAAANPAGISGYGQPANPNIPAGPMNPMRTCLTLVDRGKPWHPLFNSLMFKAGCQ